MTAGPDEMTDAAGRYVFEASWFAAESACVRLWARRFVGTVTDSVSAERRVLFTTRYPTDTVTINLQGLGLGVPGEAMWSVVARST